MTAPGTGLPRGIVSTIPTTKARALRDAEHRSRSLCGGKQRSLRKGAFPRLPVFCPGKRVIGFHVSRDHALERKAAAGFGAAFVRIELTSQLHRLRHFGD